MNRREALTALVITPAAAIAGGTRHHHHDLHHDPREQMLGSHPALRAAARALRAAQHAAEAFVDSHGEVWGDEQLAREADIMGDVCAYYAASLESETIPDLLPDRTDKSDVTSDLAEQMVAALYGAVDACCELVARHGCRPEDDCYVCQQADRAAGYLLVQAELALQDLAAAPWRLQSRSARRRAALANLPAGPNTTAAVEAGQAQLRLEAELRQLRK
jgi:hypothetical protein